MSDKIKISDVAAEIGSTPKEVITKAAEIEFDLKSAQSNVSMEEAGVILEYIQNGTIPEAVKKARAKKEADEKKKAEAALKAEQDAIKQAEEALAKEKSQAQAAASKEAKEAEAKQAPAPKEENITPPAPKAEAPKTVTSQTETTPASEPSQEQPKKPALQIKRSKQITENQQEEQKAHNREKKKKVVKKAPAKPSSTVVKSKITMDVSFHSDVDTEHESTNMLMPDFDAREDILKKLDRSNQTLNKNVRNNKKPRANPFPRQASGP